MNLAASRAQPRLSGSIHSRFERDGRLGRVRVHAALESDIRAFDRDDPRDHGGDEVLSWMNSTSRRRTRARCSAVRKSLKVEITVSGWYITGGLRRTRDMNNRSTIALFRGGFDRRDDSGSMRRARSSRFQLPTGSGNRFRRPRRAPFAFWEGDIAAESVGGDRLTRPGFSHRTKTDAPGL